MAMVALYRQTRNLRKSFRQSTLTTIFHLAVLDGNKARFDLVFIQPSLLCM